MDNVEIKKKPAVRLPMRDIVVWILLFAVMAGGYWLRSVGREWDDYTHLHPDERFLTSVANRIDADYGGPLDFQGQLNLTADEQRQHCNEVHREPTTDELARMTEEERADVLRSAGKGGYFDARCSPLNPNNQGSGLYVYGEFPMFSLRVIAESFSQLTENDEWVGYNGVYLVGRVMNSIFDTLTILLVFMIGSRLFGRWPGLLGATLYAFAAFPIQQSHFWTVDAFTSFWVVLAIYFAVRVLDNASEYPDRFAFLPWIGSGLVIGIWDFVGSDGESFEALLIFPAAMMLVAIIATLAAESRDLIFTMLGIVAGVLMLGLALAFGSIAELPAAAAAGTMIVLSILWFVDGYRVISQAGLAVWLSAAFALWVFDGLAHYDEPSFMPLIYYLVLFMLVGVFSSMVRTTGVRPATLPPIMTAGVLMILWIVVSGLSGDVSSWGLLAAVMVAGYIGFSTTVGVQDYAAFGIAFGAALAGRVNVAPVVGVLILAGILQLIPYVTWRDIRFRSPYFVTVYLVLGAVAILMAVAAFALFDTLLVGIFLLSLYLAVGIFVLDWNAPVFYQDAFWKLVGGLVVAGMATIVAFRILQPHAFLGPTFGGIFGLNPGWTEDIAEAQRLVSSEADFPPAHQWVDRSKWLYPLQSIVLYGLGGALGFTAVGAFLWALFRTLRGGRDWSRLAIPVAWVAVYFGWLGQNWVSTMRYFLPIYGMLALLAAWALWELVVYGYRLSREHPRGQAIFGAASLILVFVLGYTALYGYGFTNIYRHELTRVQASRYFHEFVPSDFGLWVETGSGNERLVNIGANPNRDSAPEILVFQEGHTEEVNLTPFNPAALISAEVHLLGDPNMDEDEESIRLQIWGEGQNGLILLGTETFNADLSQADSAAGQAYLIPFTNTYLDPVMMTTLRLELSVINGPVTISRRINAENIEFAPAHITLTYQEDGSNTISTEQVNLPMSDTTQQMLYLNPNSPQEYEFTSSASGMVTRVEVPHVLDPFADADEETISVSLVEMTEDITMEDNGSPEESTPEISGSASGNFTGTSGSVYGPTVTIELEEPFPVEADQRYKLVVNAEDLLGISGTIIANEGRWDDAIPYKVCRLPEDVFYSDDNSSGLCDFDSIGIDPYFNMWVGLELNMADEDTEDKRRRIIDILTQADLLTVSSNRFYDSAIRIPTRWPMTNRYYDALFNEELGFELVEQFESYARVGPLVWKDQVFPHDDLPAWANDFEAEEAFHVYDHPGVFIFRKTEDFSPEQVAAVLDGTLRRFSEVQLNTSLADDEPASIFTWGGGDATQSPTALQFSEEVEDIQKSGGTWSEMFSRDSLLNRYQWLGVAVWWLMMVAVGLITFPLLFVMFPALPDRGYAFGKMFGWILVAWVAWLLASLRFEVWTQGWLWVMLGLLTLFSGWVAYRSRDELFGFLREQRDHILIIEGVSLLLFLFFVGVRAGNPDLWHQSFGGEKPMNFAYLNGVLRSSVFPPVDPWFSGGYINYYYWGYVLVGAPIKALGIIPSFAYNLVLPTLYMWTGIGGFTIGYNLVQWRKTRDAVAGQTPDRVQPATNAYLAGALVLLLMMVLGNLDTPRTFARPIWRDGFADIYEEESGIRPTPQELDQIEKEASLKEYYDAFRNGFDDIQHGEPFPLAAHRWYWGPRSILTELPDGAGHNAIVEMPYFTFLYGDLHAHMIAMPVTLFVVIFVIAEVMGAGLGLRRRWAAFLSLASAALVVGLLRATNTWDWPTYMIAGLAGLTFAAWVGQNRLSQNRRPYPFFERLRAGLDLRYVASLWPLLLIIPAVILLRSGLHVYQDMRYESKLESNQIPGFCQDYDRNLDDPDVDEDTLRKPVGCESDDFKPRLDALGLVKTAGIGLAGAVGLYVVGFVVLGQRFDRRALLAWVGRLAAFFLISRAVIIPYMDSFATPYSKVLPWELEKTPLWAYLTIHGLFLFIVASLLLWQTLRWLRNHRVADLRGMGVPILAVVGVVVAIPVITFVAQSTYPAFLVALPLFLWTAVLFLLPNQSNTERLVYAAIALALGLTMGVEMYALEGDNGRQNTVFKFYIQAWLLFSIAGGVGLAWLLTAAERWNFIVRSVWQTGLAILMSIGLLYPILATQGRFADRMASEATPLTLDGMAYMKYAPHYEEGIAFNLRGDYEIITWLQENTEGTPYILEGYMPQYHWGGRINIYTGMPTVLGWNFHQRQQRGIHILNNMVWNREQNINAFYTTPDVDTAWNLIEFYDIDYIIVGTLERAIYGDIIQSPENGVLINQTPGMQKFERMEELGLIETVFSNPVCISNMIIEASECPEDRLSTDVIYRVVDGAIYETTEVASR